MTGDFYSSEMIEEINSLLIKINIKRIDLYNIRELLDIADKEFEFLDYTNLILDLRSVNYFDSTAIGGLLEMIYRKVVPNKGRVVIISEKDQIHRKVASYYDLYIVSLAETLEDAINLIKLRSSKKRDNSGER